MADIRVVIGENVKKESVVINPKVSSSDNWKTGEKDKNIMSKGKTSREALRKVYGRSN